MTISDEDIALFREMNQGVRKQQPSDRVEPCAPKPAPFSVTLDIRRTLQRSDAPTPLLQATAEVEAEEVLFYTQDQLPHTTLQKLKRGTLCSDLEFDLHGFTTAQAIEPLQQLLQHALHQRLRCFRLIHGKGRRSSDQRPVLKSFVNQWLRQQPEVLAFCSAKQKDGGTGALYVLLKRTKE
ncbi:MAG: DNA mismatch repair protein MutS [Gammaproteobacteria bacterium]|jgi:DNA-nicking Smr family endonuclease|nr:DNA mismatch repair protein MutS [Gammaproteobacteria bacterium]MBT3488917.1 DNA mismatch repair protein MutS [Gammaproteobacteria bacterium]MBT3718612.1 DNA mismatch repair protein MutS [Gammaproteobacteria bacterium]MBT3844793.1 DNA mismatch repair protein MutS [Gammaproteobacteria bacterium]MBT3892796.1 DNA mismatch repair protein MutS [Gammaproteobacteria bacterium]